MVQADESIHQVRDSAHDDVEGHKNEKLVRFMVMMMVMIVVMIMVVLIVA